MPLVVSDTSPLSALVSINQIHVLPKLYSHILIPPTVANELAHPDAPQDVRQFITSRPPWMFIEAPQDPKPIPALDPGEEAAINLASQKRALLLIDERVGRRIAANQPWSLEILGTLAVLEQSAVRGYLDLVETLNSLQSLRFRIHPRLIQEALRRDKERKQHFERTDRVEP